MTAWLSKKYIGLISPRLRNFKRVNDKTYNCSCNLCGDSVKNKHKARGYFIQGKEGNYTYYCHNCGASMGLEKFIEQLDPSLYKEYVFEKLKEKGEAPKERKAQSDVEMFAMKMKKPTFIKTTALNTLKKISQLPYNHPAKVYVQKRQIPNRYHAKLFYAPKFKKFVNSVVPGKFESEDNDEPRLIIPFLNEDKQLFGFQGRSFKAKTNLRYITVMIDESMSKVFNLDEVDQSKPHYILEGPIDSMFVPNSIAMAGSDIDFNYVHDKSIFVYDNEPRSPETCKKIEKIIDKGYQVVIFPSELEAKDINDMILGDKNLDIVKLLRDNTYRHLEAKMIFTYWKRT